jgi:methylmalonyl-CoA mutase
LARNIQHILQQESHLDLTNDPSRGSYYIESLTKEMAGAAWEHFRRLERQGGMLAALKMGTVQKSLANLWETRRRRIADRRDPITGISFYADPDEASPPNTDPSSPGHPSEQTETPPISESDLVEIESIESHRDSADYEDLRRVADRITDVQGTRPAVFVLPIPDLLQVRESVSFARNFFRAGGFRVIVSDGGADPSNDDSERFPREDWSQINSQIVCICSESGISQQIEGKLASEAKQAGATSVVRVSLEPDGSEPPAPPDVDLSIHPGTDAVALLTRLLDTIGDASGGGG